MPAPAIHFERRDRRVLAANDVLTGGASGNADPAAATSLYRQALEKGCGAAAERLAVLAAVGVGRASNWPEALDLLLQAAELGYEPAQGQLAVLAGRGDAAGDGGQGLWKTLRGEIDLKALLKPLPLRRVHTSPATALIDGLATPDMCKWIISRGRPRLERGMVGDYRTGGGTPDPSRTGLSVGFGLADADIVLIATQERLARTSGLMVRQQEAPHLLSYEPGQEYKAHFDFFPPGEPAFRNMLEVMGQRVATCLTWLNDGYEGGETAFLKIGWKHRGGIGDAMLFLNVTQPDKRPDGMSLHAGLPVTRGRKYLLSQWIRDKPQPIV